MTHAAPRVLIVALAAAILTTFGTAVATVAVRSAQPAEVAGPQAPPGARSLAALPADPQERLLGVATFGTRPGERQISALRSLGLEVQPLRRLPLALVAGTRSQLTSAVQRRVVRDVHPNESLRYFSAGSTAAIGADRLRARGLTGRGVGVAVVDTGIDATHPDLADHVVRNVKLVGAEHRDVLGGKARHHEPPGTLVVPVDQTPYSNSDTTSGHGTHVAGIVAADGHTSPAQVGVAPDAHLVGYGAGDALAVFNVLAAFDDVLVHQRDLGIRVVNNSWGSPARLFDPDHPINVATKALHDAGVVVVFAAGNSAEEGTVNPWSVAPWVISVGSTTVSKQRSDFSSGGYQFDNSTAAPVPGGGHVRFEGDRVGLYHPDVSAPGSDIESSATPTGLAMTSPALPGGTATASGTSMASPHVAGLAALLLQARPSLTPDQVRQVLIATATPLPDGSAFWQSGHGLVDAEAAADLVLRPDFDAGLLDRAEKATEAAVLAGRSHPVRTSDLWSFTPAPVTAAGVDTRSFYVRVPGETRAVKAVVSYPSTSLVGLNPMDWRITVRDAGGAVVATSTPSEKAGVSSLFVDLTDPPGPAGSANPPAEVSFGGWTVEVAGMLGASDTDFAIGNVVTLAVAQLGAPNSTSRPPAPTFAAGEPLRRYLHPGPGTVLPLPSPDGCAMAAEAPRGTMADAPFAEQCRSAPVGFAVTHGAGTPAEFSTAAPLDHPVTLGGRSTLTLWLADVLSPAWSQAFASRIGYALDALDPEGRASPIASGHMERKVGGPQEVGAEPVRADYTFDLPPTAVPAGSTLRLRLTFSGVYSSTMRAFFGGRYADAGIELGTGRLVR